MGSGGVNGLWGCGGGRPWDSGGWIGNGWTIVSFTFGSCVNPVVKSGGGRDLLELRASSRDELGGVLFVLLVDFRLSGVGCVYPGGNVGCSVCVYCRSHPCGPGIVNGVFPVLICIAAMVMVVLGFLVVVQCSGNRNISGQMVKCGRVWGGSSSGLYCSPSCRNCLEVSVWSV